MAWTKGRYSIGVICLVTVVIAAVLGWRLYRPPALYRVMILPSLDGHDVSAAALNDLGQVVGCAFTGDGAHLFLWDRESGMQDLGSVVVVADLAINNARQIAGSMSVDPNDQQAFLWEPGVGRTMIENLKGKVTTPHAMNNRGQIVGTCYDRVYPDSASCEFIWDKAEGIRELKTPDGAPCRAQSINDAGQILAFQDEGISSRWFLLDPNGLAPLDTAPWRVWLGSVNNRSCAAGFTEPNGNSPRYVVFMDGQRRWKRLFRIEGVEMTRLNDNNQIAITGSTRSPWDNLRDWLLRRRSTLGREASYLWDPARGCIPLDRYVRGIQSFVVRDLNNNGCIVGTGEMKDGSSRAILLEPIPERWGK